jgi:hypothetical protein
VSARAAYELIAAGARHRAELAALVDTELHGWREAASVIPDPTARALALAKLDGEAGHARAATMLATLAPRNLRRPLARTIFATELLYDYLDGRTEAITGPDRLAYARRTYTVFTDACAMQLPRIPDDAGDYGYLTALAATVREGLAELPSALLVRDSLATAAKRAGEAQARLHCTPRRQLGDLERWARRSAHDTGLGWREHLAGCGASVLCVHALALRATRREGPPARTVDHAYLRLAALATLLDGLIDVDPLGPAEQPSYAHFYESNEHLGGAILTLASRARPLLTALGPRHEMMLAGLVAHYSNLPGAHQAYAAPTIEALCRDNRAVHAVAMLALPRGECSPGSSVTESPAAATIPHEDELWPGFHEGCFDNRLSENASRQRRFGRRRDAGEPA